MEIRFNMNHKKSIEVILYIIQKLGGSVNQYNLMKILFEADKYHLNHYARPVTGDTYIAMEYGTVPRAIRDYVDSNHWYLGLIEREQYPFSLDRKTWGVVSQEVPNLDYLSESDIEAIDCGIEKYGNLPFDMVCQLNHQEKAWVKTRNNNPNKPIPFEEFIDNKDILNVLQETAEFIVI